MSTIQRLSPEVHKKGWGSELWITNNGRYCGKLLRFRANGAFSMHYHLEKHETWYVLSGILNLTAINTADATRYVMQLQPGDVIEVPRGAPHQLTAVTEAEILETSTPHDEADSYRIAPGDSQRAKSV